MQKEVCHQVSKRFPLFPGRYCYPVSPNTLSDIEKSTFKIIADGYPHERNDQMVMILSTLGKPTQEEMSFLSD